MAHQHSFVSIEFDRQADAVYIRLADKPYSYGKDLDTERRVDFSADGSPIGVELLTVSKGVEVDDLPFRDEVAQLLDDLHIRVFA